MADRRLAIAARLALRLLLRLQLGHVGRAEIDRVKQQRREAEILHRLGDNLPGEWEQHARRLDQQEGRKRFFRNVAEGEQAGIGQVDDEVRAIVRLGADLDLQRDLMDIVGDLAAVQAELDVQRRLALPLENLRSGRTFGRQILDILRDRRCVRSIRRPFA